MDNTELPAQFIVDNLRNEIARLNDERITLSLRLNYAETTIATLNGRIEALENTAINEKTSND